MDNFIQSSKNNSMSKQDDNKLPTFLLNALDHIDNNYIANTAKTLKS